MREREKFYRDRESTVDQPTRDRIVAMSDKQLQAAIEMQVLDMSNQSAGHPRLAALASEARHRNLSSTADMAAGVLAHGAHEYDEAWTEAKRDADMVESWEAKTNATASVNDVTLLAVIPVKIGDLIEQGERDVADTVSAVRALGRAQQHHLDANPHGDFSPSVTIANTGE